MTGAIGQRVSSRSSVIARTVKCCISDCLRRVTVPHAPGLSASAGATARGRPEAPGPPPARRDPRRHPPPVPPRPRRPSVPPAATLGAVARRAHNRALPAYRRTDAFRARTRTSPRRTASSPRTAILLCNLGTPDAPTAAAVRRYLAQFLGDPRVVEIPARVAADPARHHAARAPGQVGGQVRQASGCPKARRSWCGPASQARLLAATSGQRGSGVRVAAAMRYGNPSIAAVLDSAARRRRRARARAAALSAVRGEHHGHRVRQRVAPGARAAPLPEFRFVKRLTTTTPPTSTRLAKRGRPLARERPPRSLVMSFHGMPQRTLDLGDPYHCSARRPPACWPTELALAPRAAGDLPVALRAGRMAQPYTEPTLGPWRGEGVERVDVMCPGFAADCLETLEEIAHGRGARPSCMPGGKAFHYIPCLNDQPAWIEALAASRCATSAAGAGRGTTRLPGGVGRRPERRRRASRLPGAQTRIFSRWTIVTAHQRRRGLGLLRHALGRRGRSRG